SRFRHVFFALLARASSEAAFAAVTGAPLLLSRLDGSEQYRVALATGAWRDSARLKMASAGLSYDDYPAASSDDAFDRESIIRLSMKRAAERYGGLGRTVFVGGGGGGARARGRDSIPFVGIGTWSRAPT